MTLALPIKSETHRSNRVFIRHYLEMVAAMFAGMFALGMPVGRLLAAFGAGTLSGQMMLLTMSVEMSVGMAAWMLYRAHTLRQNVEMIASMLFPTAVIMALVAAGVLGGMGAMVIEHVGMLISMLAVMLARRDEYSSHAGHGHGLAEAAVA